MCSDTEDNEISHDNNITVSKSRNNVTAVSSRQVFILKEQQDNEWCDVTLYGKNSAGSRGIKGHKIILSSASAHLREAFTSKDFTDSGAKEYRISQIDHAILEVIVKFIYTNTLRLDGENDMVDRLKSVLIGADYLLMADLREVCGESLKDSAFLTVNCAVTMWLFARKYHCKVLEDAALRKIDVNLGAVAAQTDYLNLDDKNVLALLKALVAVKAVPNLVCEAAIAWLGYKQGERFASKPPGDSSWQRNPFSNGERKKHCDEIMRQVRLRDMSIEVLQRTSECTFLSEQVLWAVKETLAMRISIDDDYKQKLTAELRSATSKYTTEQRLSEKRRIHLALMINQAEVIEKSAESAQRYVYSGNYSRDSTDADKKERAAARKEASNYVHN